MRPRGLLAFVAGLWLLTVAGCGGDQADDFASFESAPLSEETARLLAEVAAVRQLPVPTSLELGTVPRDRVDALIDSSLTEADRRWFQQTTTLYRLLGYLNAEQDYLDIYREFAAEAVIGLYLPAEDKLWVVREGEFDLAALSRLERSTLVHEFLHAIQDARFDLATTSGAVQFDLDRSLAYTSIVEGDAVTHESLFATKASASPGGAVLLLKSNGSTANVPAAIERELRFPYTTGAEWVNILRATTGVERVNQLLAGEPISTAQILHPELFESGWQPDTVALPDVADGLGSGWKRESGGTLGEFHLRNYLQSKLPAIASVTAAAGWSGDRYDVYRQGEEAVALFRVRFRDAGQAEELTTALAEFERNASANTGIEGRTIVAEFPGGRVSVRLPVSGNDVVFALATSREAAVRAIALLGEGSP